MNDRARLLLLDLATALALVFGLLLAFELTHELADTTISSARWQLVVIVGLGAGLATAIFSDRIPARPLLFAGVVLAWPVVSIVTSVPGPPSWIPLLRDTTIDNARTAAVSVGVLLAGSWLRR